MKGFASRSADRNGRREAGNQCPTRSWPKPSYLGDIQLSTATSETGQSSSIRWRSAQVWDSRQPRSWLPDWSDLWTGFPSLAALLPGHLIRLEEEIADGHYLLRAELPGIDPAKDVDITVRDGQFTIKAERTEKKEAKGRSEFSYGSFTRSVTLPAGANEDDSKPATTRAS